MPRFKENRLVLAALVAVGVLSYAWMRWTVVNESMHPDSVVRPGDTLFVTAIAGPLILFAWVALMACLVLMRPIRRGTWWAPVGAAFGAVWVVYLGGRDLVDRLGRESPVLLGVVADVAVAGVGLAALAFCGWLLFTSRPAVREAVERPSVL